MAKWFGTSTANTAASPILKDVEAAKKKDYTKRRFSGEALVESRAALAQGAEEELLAIEEAKLRKVHDFAAYGRTGGRPRGPKELLRGVAGGESSNRLQAGQERRRIEITALEGKQMCEYIKSKKEGYVDLQAFFGET